MWLVGLWEGEGCFYLTSAAKNKYPAMSIEMNDEDIIKRCADLMEKPYHNTKHNTSRMTLSGRGAVPWIKLMKPYLGKRRQAKIVEIFSQATHNYDEITIIDNDITVGVQNVN